MNGFAQYLGLAVISLVMFCAVLGAIASIFRPASGLGKEFLDGLHAIGYIFVPVAGIMAAVPILSQAVRAAAGPLYATIGADPAMAATSFIAVDMGGYQLARSLTSVNEAWIMAMITGCMAGATIVFSIPVGLALLDEEDHSYLALGILSGVLSIPIGVLISSLLLWLLHPAIRPEVSTSGAADYTLALTWPMILINLAPLAIIVLLIALGLHFFPQAMIRGFMIFGRTMDAGIKLVLVACIVEYFTKIFFGVGAFTWLFGVWNLDPIIADEKDQLRALEVAGYIGTMLAGAFPMVYLIRKFLEKPMELLGARVGLETAGAAGLLATVANILAMFRLIREMRPRDKVINISFAVCAAFLFGDHLAFTANFQPTLLVPILAGKLGGGIAGCFLACWLTVPKATLIERERVRESGGKERKEGRNNKH